VFVEALKIEEEPSNSTASITIQMCHLEETKNGTRRTTASHVLRGEIHNATHILWTELQLSDRVTSPDIEFTL